MKLSIVYATLGFSVLLPGLPMPLSAQIPSAETNAAPAAAALSGNGIDYVAWMGKDKPTARIWYAASANNGGAWTPQYDTGFQTTQAPALASAGSALYLAYRGDSTFNPADNIWFSTCTSVSTCTPSSWSSPAEVCGSCATTAAPALAASCSPYLPCSLPLYMAWTTASDTIEVASYNGSAWTVLDTQPMASPAPGTAPAIAVYEDTVVLAWLQGKSESPCGGLQCYQVMYATLPTSGGYWSSITPSVAVSAVPPALGVYRAVGSLGATMTTGLYMAWYVPGGVDYSEWDAGSWGATVPVPGLPIPPGPLTPALDFSVSIPPGACGSVTTYEFALVYAAPASGESYDDLYLSKLDSNSVVNKYCPKQ